MSERRGSLGPVPQGSSEALLFGRALARPGSDPQGGAAHGSPAAPAGRAKAMLAAATHGGGGKKPAPGGRVTPPQEVITFQRRKAKRAPAEDLDDFPLFSGMAATPKKQRSGFEQTPLQPARLPPLSLGQPRGGERPPLRLKSVTSTQLVDCYASQQSRQALREQRLRADEDARRRLYSGGGWGAARGGGALSRLPAGMLNLGNTCYLNAVLQVLLSLPSFVADLQRGQQQLAAAGQPLSGTGVYAALLDCVAAKEAGGRAYLTPTSLKRALDAGSAAFRGAFQQDAHELFCGLLELLQGEVLAREAARYRRYRICASETADPGARTFGFAVRHELRCRTCGTVSHVVEQYSHLSLELPEAQPGGAAPVSSVGRLLAEYFKEEEVEKACERCGGANVAHALRHAVQRLPRVLCLHLKRFKVTWDAKRQAVTCQKLHTGVEIPEAVDLGGFLAAAAQPPLPGGQHRDPGKENEQQAANPSQNSGGFEGAAADAHVARPDSDLRPRSGVRFYGDGSGGGGGGATPIASHALLQPTPAGASPAALSRRRPGTPGAGGLPSGRDLAAEEEEEALQQALAMSLLEQGAGEAPTPTLSPLQPQQQAGLLHRFPEIEAGADGVAAASGSPSAACLPHGAAAAVGEGTEGGPRSQGGWIPGARAAARWQGGDVPASAAAALGGSEEEELQRAIQLSMLEEQQRRAAPRAAAAPADADDGAQAPTHASAADPQEEVSTPRAACSGLPALGDAAAAAAREAEDADLQRALQLSLLDGGPGAPPAPAAPGGQQDVQSGQLDTAGDQGGAAPASAPCLAELVEDDLLQPDCEPGAGRGLGGAAVALHVKPPPAAYRLHASVGHEGPAASCGHFTADVCDPGSRAWHRFSDSLATRIGAADARGGRRQRECYMLFYVHGSHAA